MPVLNSNDQFLEVVTKSGLIEAGRLAAYLHELGTRPNLPIDPKRLAAHFVRDGVLTKLQAEHLLQGKHKGFVVDGKYKILELLGVGAMGKVFLCEHLVMRRLLALKVFAFDKNVHGPSAVERFYREARAVGSLNHPNIVWAHDLGQDGRLHYMAMEYVDGTNLHEIVARHGPMDITRAAHYVAQAAAGLQHAHEAGWVHRDIKPANFLLDRQGAVKILDLGLARLFTDDSDGLTQQYDQNNVLGTADFLAPEQALDCHSADIRADIYGLGATFYYLLTANPPFPTQSIAQKLISHQIRKPAPVRAARPDVPEALQAVIEKMMAKEREGRYPKPAEVAQALASWTATPIPPPPSAEMPRLSPAVLQLVQAGGNQGGPAPAAAPSTPRPVTSAPSNGTSSVMSALMSACEMETKVGTPSSSRTSPQHAPLSGRPVPGGAREPAREPPQAAKRLSRRWVAAAAAAIITAGVGVASWTAFRSPAASVPDRPSAAADEAAVTNPGGAVPVPPGSLVVSASGEAGTFRTIRDALARARPGGRVVVLDGVHEEQLILDGLFGNDVSVEAWAPSALPVIWRLPPGPNDSRPLIQITGTAGLRLKGFVMDGRDRVKDLVCLSGACPGVTLEDLHLRGFTRAAVALQGCAGNTQRPVALRRVRCSTARETAAAVSLETDPASARRPNEHVHVHACRFEGPYRAAVLIGTATADLDLRNNRFFRSAAGVRYHPAKPNPPLQMNVVGNTFCELQKGLHFEAPPPPDGSRLVVTNNLFLRTAQLAALDRTVPLGDPRPILPIAAGNVRSSGRAEGYPVLASKRGVLDDAAFTLSTNPDDDARFLRYPIGHALTTAGANGSPVGVPPRP